MGQSSSGNELARKFSHLGRELNGLPRAGVSASALHVKKSVLRVSPARLRGVGKKGAKLGVKYVIRDGAGSAYARVSATGPWQLIESDTSPHRIPKGGGKRGRKKRYAVIPGVGVRAFANHPGTKGKHPWRKGVELARPQVQAEFRGGLTKAMRKVF